MKKPKASLPSQAPFSAELAPANAKMVGGFAAGGPVDPAEYADEVFRGSVPGPWLTCYMLRRFGWPNIGGDSHKDLCCWALTTPLPGLYLQVSPYLGGSNLHFAVRFNAEVQQGIRRDPGRESYFARREKALRKWWALKGRKLYSLGVGKKQGDEDELVHAYGERGDQVYGLWRRKPSHKWPNTLPKTDAGMLLWWLGEFLKKHHPEVKLPKMSKRERKARITRFHMKVQSAIKTTMRDLLRPTGIRDLSFTPFGDLERDREAIKRYAKQKPAGRFEGAGNAPSYWFAPKNVAARKRQGAIRD